MNNDYHTLNNVILPLSMENWQNILQQSLNERPLYQLDQNQLTYGQVVIKLLGISLDEDEYYNQLYEWVYESNNNVHLLSEETLDRTIDNKHFQAIQKVMNILHDQDLSINRLVAFLDGESVLVKSSTPAIHRKIRESTIKVLKVFAERETKGIKNAELRRVLVDLVKWSYNHLVPALEESQKKHNMPKFLWYGDASKSQVYFIYYLLSLGCDMLFVHPQGKDILEYLELDKEVYFTHHYPQTKSPEPFPKEKRRRTATVAYRASREIENILHYEGSNLYKPWQFRDYIPSSVTLKTTYDEIFLLEKESAMIRPNFEVSNGEVFIPSLFTKIMGVSRKRSEYWDRLHKVADNEHAMLIKKFPFTRAIISDYRYHYRGALRNGKLDPELMISAHYWTYSQLPIGLQKGLAAAISRVCQKPMLKRSPDESEEETSIFLFAQSLLIPNDILKLLQKFDYSQEIPSIIVFKTEVNGTFTREDAAILLLMNAIGLDIIIYNPPGHLDIENFVSEVTFDVHWLEDIVFELEYKEPSFIKRGFLSGLLKNRKGE